MYTDIETTEGNENDSKISKSDLVDFLKIYENTNKFRTINLKDKTSKYFIHKTKKEVYYTTKAQPNVFQIPDDISERTYPCNDPINIESFMDERGSEFYEVNRYGGATKYVLHIEGSDKVFAIANLQSNEAKLMREISCLKQLEEAGFNVPKTYTKGFGLLLQEGSLPKVDFTVHDNAGVLTEYKGNPFFAMDYIGGKGFDLWKEGAYFTKKLIEEFPNVNDARQKLIEELVKLNNYLEHFAIADLQMTINKEDGVITLMDPIEIYDLTKKDEEEKIKNHAEYRWPLYLNCKKVLNDAIYTLDPQLKPKEDTEGKYAKLKSLEWKEVKDIKTPLQVFDTISRTVFNRPYIYPNLRGVDLEEIRKEIESCEFYDNFLYSDKIVEFLSGLLDYNPLDQDKKQDLLQANLNEINL